MARAVEQHKTKPAKRTSRRRTSQQSGRGSRKNPSKAEPSPWLLLDDVFQPWRDRLGSSEEAVDELYALLCDPETRSAYVSASGEETPSPLPVEFWRDIAHLLVTTDTDGVDHLKIRYPDYVHGSAFLPGGRVEFLVRRVDVERWERLYPALAAPPPAPSKKLRAAKGPVRGEIDRFGAADRALFPEIKRLMKLQRLTRTEAIRQIPEDKLAGRGTLDSRIRRVSDRFRREKP